ncbi:MAG: hypothetical protein IID40_11345, partial [Planctomycetes bacterium]|nr:hypothetical protein [Planctomycetota bacterium]
MVDPISYNLVRPSVGSAAWALGLAVLIGSATAAAAPSDPGTSEGIAAVARRGAIIPITG